MGIRFYHSAISRKPAAEARAMAALFVLETQGKPCPLPINRTGRYPSSSSKANPKHMN